MCTADRDALQRRAPGRWGEWLAVAEAAAKDHSGNMRASGGRLEPLGDLHTLGHSCTHGSAPSILFLYPPPSFPLLSSSLFGLHLFPLKTKVSRLSSTFHPRIISVSAKPSQLGR